MTQTCKDCKYFNIKDARIDRDGVECNEFECRRHAPRWISGVGTGENYRNFSHVYPDDWCGEFVKKDEKKDAHLEI